MWGNIPVPWMVWVLFRDEKRTEKGLFYKYPMGSVVETRQAQSLPMTYAIGYFSYSSYSSLNSYSYMWVQGVYTYIYIHCIYP